MTEPATLEPEPWPGWSAPEPAQTTIEMALCPKLRATLESKLLEPESLEPELLEPESLGLESLPTPASDAMLEPRRDTSTKLIREVLPVQGNFLFRRVPRCLVVFGLLLFVGVFASLHLRNHRAFGSLAYDTAISVLAVWLMGRTANPVLTVRGLYVHGHHVNPFLFVLVPISWLGGGAEAFLVAQTVCFALGAIPIFGLTRYLIAGAPGVGSTSLPNGSRGLRWLQPTSNPGAEWLAAGVALAYLGSPMIQWINWAHFHPESFATLPFLCGWWAMLRRRWGWFGLCVAILISTREETALAVTMMGVVMLWRTFTLRRGASLLAGKRPSSAKSGWTRMLRRCFAAPPDVVLRDAEISTSPSNGAADPVMSAEDVSIHSRRQYFPGVATSLVGGGWYLLCTRIILPKYNNGRPPYYLKSFFGSFGGSVGGIVNTFFTDPGKIISLATKKDRLDYYWALGRPVGFLFLLSPVHLLMVLPSMLSNVLTDSQYPRQIEYQYASVLAGPLWIATIYALAKLRRHLRLMGVVLTAVLGLTYYAEQDFSPAPISERGQIYWAKPDARSASLTAAVRLIPPNAGVSASDFVLPHLDRRRHAYLWPNPFEERYWGNYDPVAPTPLPNPNNVDWFVIDDRLLQLSDGVLAETLTEADGPFEVVFKSNGVIVGKRKPGHVSPPVRR